MPINQVFTNGNDSFVATQNDSYFLGFLNGDDTLTVNGATQTTALMGSGDDRVTVRTGSSLLYGEGGDDRFDLYASAASAYGGTDNDLFYLRGGSGNSVYGEEGSDKFIFLAGGLNLLADGGDGNDIFDGGRLQMNALIIGGAGNDTFSNFRDFGGAYTIDIFGGTGNDLYRADPGGAANFVEYAGEGTDTVQVARYTDYVLPENIENLAVIGFLATPLAAATLTGNSLNNTIYGWNGDETVYGLDGNDRIFAKGGFDVLYGGNGNDLLDGGAGDDLLSGGDGNDILNGRAGNDTMAGGVGDDSYYVDSDGDVANEAADGGTDTVRTTVNFTLSDNIERLIGLGSNGLTLTGNVGNNSIYGGSGNDELWGRLGNDYINGGAGDDIIQGEEGDDTLIGGSGYDQLAGGDGNDYLDGGEAIIGNDMFGELGDDTYIVRTQYDYVQDGTGYDVAYVYAPEWDMDQALLDEVYLMDAAWRILGDEADTYIQAGDGSQVDHYDIEGGGGNDTLIGSAIVDRLTGGDGNDTLEGFAGDDLLAGGAGADSLAGGEGMDQFRLVTAADSAPGSADVIHDFGAGDVIDLSYLDGNTSDPFSDTFNFIGNAAPSGDAGELWYVADAEDSSHFTIYGDVDGDGTPDLQIELYSTVGAPTVDIFIL